MPFPRLATLTAAAIAAAALLAAATATAQTIQLNSYFTGLTRPVFITHDGTGNGKLYILEKNTANVRIYEKGTSTLLATPFFSLTGLVNTGNEEGLLGIAFHPNYAANRRFFLYYTNTSGNNVLIEARRSAGDPNVADSATTTILGLPHPTHGNHNGGCMAFGPDGYLYVGTGDGGGSGDPFDNGQNINALNGKMLRLDIDSTTSTYTVPADNPFVGGAGLDEIYAIGLRNPWRFSFDDYGSGATNRLFVGDVGQNAYEEVNLVELGDNLGWADMEGPACYKPSVGCITAGRKLPIHYYPHASSNQSITGGYVYRGSLYPGLVGKYIYADFISGRIWALTETSPGVFANQLLLEPGFNIASFGRDEDGELFVIRYVNSAATTSIIYRLVEVSAVADSHLY